jgi:hypothetical protein
MDELQEINKKTVTEARIKQECTRLTQTRKWKPYRVDICSNHLLERFKSISLQTQVFFKVLPQDFESHGPAKGRIEGIL